MSIALRRVLVSVVGVVLLGACGSSDPLGGRSEWDATAASDVATLARRVATAIPGACDTVRPTDFATFAMSIRRAGFHEVPQAQASCELGDETVEFSRFESNAARDAYVNDRTKVICRIALHPRDPSRVIKGFPGLRWTLGDRWTVQVDTQDAGRRIATALDGTYTGRPCDGERQDWDAAAADRVLAQLARLDRSVCPQPQLDNHDTARVSQFAGRTMPAASAACSAEGSSVHLVEFGPAVTDRDAWVAAVYGYYCRSAAGSALVRDQDWAAVVRDGATAQRVVDALGATVAATRCPTGAAG